ncbi:hypothetical protein GZ77_14960 [Endozoicomonas montiporae]|uniref:HTH merR-type domain-containing protein n=1 Tax=Endozoicomonas montiporae TaxID=1027273 RepID=A0A081N591_9GAMM|nr:MerR family transcriptional regulator [Endozoicomonas montiporae]KEQ13614.1 hypothetical protein GZ77_14960 [Endozoicomonas montiporae]
MYKISELARKAGLSRSTLLYYEKTGLLCGQRSSNGYRYYSDLDLQRLILIKQLQAGGLSLKDCLSCLNKGPDPALLRQRLATLDQEIAQKQQARQLLGSLLGEDSTTLRRFHQHLEQTAPLAHGQWLQARGLNETDSLHVRWLSHNPYEHDGYMNDFKRIFEGLERHGPGSEKDSLWALSQVPGQPENILDIGCGTGASTFMLAEQTSARITALDNLQESLDFLQQQAESLKLRSRVTTCNASMTSIPFAPASFDLLWSEGSAYIMGFANALKQWRSLLSDNGYLVISDLVWTDELIDDEITDFWKTGYPDMQTVEHRLEQCRQHGYKVKAHRMMGKEAWDGYTRPLEQRLDELEPTMPDSLAIKDLRKEINILDRFEGRFTYMIMVLKKSPETTEA